MSMAVTGRDVFCQSFCLLNNPSVGHFHIDPKEAAAITGWIKTYWKNKIQFFYIRGPGTGLPDGMCIFIPKVLI
jgi:hypothetical protein